MCARRFLLHHQVVCRDVPVTTEAGACFCKLPSVGAATKGDVAAWDNSGVPPQVRRYFILRTFPPFSHKPLNHTHTHRR